MPAANETEAKIDPKPATPMPADKGELSDADLDKVAGGINPQPLPPGMQRHEH